MDYVDADKRYILISKFEEGVEPTSRIAYGRDLIAELGEEKFQNCFSGGKTFIYKGREYFVDEAL